MAGRTSSPPLFPGLVRLGRTSFLSGVWPFGHPILQNLWPFGHTSPVSYISCFRPISCLPIVGAFGHTLASPLRELLCARTARGCCRLCRGLGLAKKGALKLIRGATCVLIGYMLAMLEITFTSWCRRCACESGDSCMNQCRLYLPPICIPVGALGTMSTLLFVQPSIWTCLARLHC